MASPPVALIVDIVRSRELPDRQSAQESIVEAFDTASSVGGVLQSLAPTVGDEFQAVFSDIASALAATCLVRLTLPAAVECRFGLGRGEIRDVEPGARSSVQDGSAWWRARDAIDEAHRREGKRNPYLRGWFISESAGGEFESIVNALLVMRDSVISGMRPRERRLTAGVLLGRSQLELARSESISQSAVSQSLQKSGGAAIVAAHQLIASTNVIASTNEGTSP